MADPWETARTRYLERLDADEAVLFNEATIQNLYYGTSNADREDKLKSKTRNAIAAIQPLVDKIEEYGKAMDTFANIAPTFLAPVWGNLRVVLVLASGFGRFYERMTDTLGRIGDILPRLLDYQRIFSHDKHPRLSESLANTYLDIIELCMEFRGMIKVQRKSVLKRVMQPLSSGVEQKFKDAEARFRAHRKTVEREAETCHMIEAAEARAIVLRDRQLQEMNNKAETRRKLFALLSVTGNSQKHAKVRSMRYKETGSWLFATAEYKAWRGLKTSATLCCYGIPGCRKTILASSVVDSLLSVSQRERSPVGYHYCDHADKRTLEPITILGTLVRSLLEDVEIPPEMVELIQGYYRDGERIPETKDVLDILSNVIGLFEGVIIAVDGIDEVKEEDRQSVYDALKGLAKSSQVPVKAFISSREDTELTLASIPGSSFRVQVSEKVISTDIDGYISHSVAFLLSRGDLVVRKPDLQQDIVNALIKGAKGMFLWVKFQLDELCRAESDSAIKTILLNLPKDLGETYDRLLGRIVEAERQELVKRMLRWIICARRPMLVDELCEGIAFTIDDKCWDEDKIPTDILRLVRACGNLVVIDDESRIVQLAHYTVQQYILDAQASKDKFFHFNLAEADELIGEVCVAYLSFSDFETKITLYTGNNVTAAMTAMERPSQIPSWLFETKKTKPVEHLLEHFRLLAYVKENWLWHTSRFLPTGRENTRRDTLFQDLVLEKQLPFSFRPWRTNANMNTKYIYLEPIGWALVANHCPLIHTIMKNDPSFDPGEYFAYAGAWFFEDTNSNHISNNMLEHIKDCTLGSWDPKLIPGQAWLYSRMLTACRRGNVAILRLCVPELRQPTWSRSRKLPRDMIDYQWSKLRGHVVIEAAASGQQGLINWLLGQEQRGPADMAYIETRSYSEADAEHIARYKSFTVEHDGLDCNALERATLAGHVEVASSLCQRGWHASRLLSDNARRGIQRLNKAAEEGNSLVFAALLNLFQMQHHRPPGYEQLIEEAAIHAFLRASSAGHVAVVQECINHGLDPLRPDARGRFAYFEAIRSGKHEVVKYLATANVGCGVEPTAEGLPLSMAASVGKLQVAEVLVAQGAEIFPTSRNEWENGFVAVTDEDVVMVEISPAPLYVAAANGHDSMVEYLLELGAEPDIPSPTGLLSRSIKLRANEPTLLSRRRLFLSNSLPEGISTEDDVALGQRPLTGAVMNGHVEVVKLLLATGVNVNAQDSNGDCALLVAASVGQSEVVKLLLQAGATLEGMENRTPHHLATCVSDDSKMKALGILLDLGVSPNIKLAWDRQSALHYACNASHAEIVELLLSNSAPINAATLRGYTPLHVACIRRNSSIVKVLLHSGADIDCRLLPPFHSSYTSRIQPIHSPRKGTTPLILAVTNPNIAIISELLEAGADTEAVDWNGQTALICAVKLGIKNAVGALVNGGASVRSKDREGCGALQVALKAQSLDMIEYLLMLHDVAVLQNPLKFIFTSKDSGEALEYAITHFEGDKFEKGIDEVCKHFRKAKRFQIEHQEGRQAELQKMWESSIVTSPEDEKPYDTRTLLEKSERD